MGGGGDALQLSRQVGRASCPVGCSGATPAMRYAQSWEGARLQGGAPLSLHLWRRHQMRRRSVAQLVEPGRRRTPTADESERNGRARAGSRLASPRPDTRWGCSPQTAPRPTAGWPRRARMGGRSWRGSPTGGAAARVRTPRHPRYSAAGRCRWSSLCAGYSSCGRTRALGGVW